MKSSNIIKVRDSKLYNNNIKEDIKILSAGDFHINPKTKEENIDFYLDSVYEEHPDYICLLGDIIDSPIDIDETKELVLKLIKDSSEIAPTFVILGNHDYIYNHEMVNINDLWKEINNIDNVRLLNDKVYQNDEIAIMGYTQKLYAYYNNINSIISDSDMFYNDLVKYENLYNIDINVPKIALIHSPEFIIEQRNQELLKNYDLIICGHYHNGCVPPILDKFWNSDKGFINARRYMFPSNVRGIQKLDYNYLIYNGGWVKLSKSSGLKILDSLFNRHMDITTLTGDSDYEKIEIKTRYKKKHKKIF